MSVPKTAIYEDDHAASLVARSPLCLTGRNPSTPSPWTSTLEKDA